MAVSLRARPGDAQALKSCIVAAFSGTRIELAAQEGAAPSNLFGSPAVLLCSSADGVQLAEPNAAAAYVAGEVGGRDEAPPAAAAKQWRPNAVGAAAGAHAATVRVLRPHQAADASDCEQTHTHVVSPAGHACTRCCAGSSCSLRPTDAAAAAAVDRWLLWEADSLRPAAYSGDAAGALQQLEQGLAAAGGSFLAGPGITLADVSEATATTLCGPATFAGYAQRCMRSCRISSRRDGA